MPINSMTVSASEQIDVSVDQHQMTADTGTACVSVTRQPLLYTETHAKIDDGRLLESLDSVSESILPAVQEMHRAYQNEKTFVSVVDKDIKSHTMFVVTTDTVIPVEDDLKSKHLLTNSSETNAALPSAETQDIAVDSNAESKQTLCTSSKVSSVLDGTALQPAEGCEEEDDVEEDLVMAAEAVEKALGDSESHLEHRQEAEEEKKTTFGNAESLRFQNSMFELVEELRIRRTMDAENETKMKQFLTEKHLLENKHEEAVSRNETLRTEHLAKVAAVKKQFEDRMSQLRDENARYASRCDATEKEMKLLKDEIRTSQLSKYTLEKRLQELEQKLQLQTTTKESHLSRLAELDTLADSVNKQMTDLTVQQTRLENNVIEAEKLNRKLQYVNSHQTCLIDEYKNELAQLQQDLMKTKVKLDQQPTIIHSQQLEERQKIKVLEDALNSQKDYVALLSRQLEEKKSEHEKTVESLSVAHSLVEQQVDLNNHHTEVARNYKDTISELTTQLTALKADYDAKSKQLDIETQSHEKTVAHWESQHQSLTCQLKTLQEEHETLVKHQTDLEELNSQWARKNLALVEEAKRLKDELNKPKSDVALQTEADVSDVALQTEMEVSNVALQTEVEVTEVALQTEVEVTETGVQTRAVGTTDTKTQTDGQTSDVKSSQTDHVTSVHQFIQTEDYSTEDVDKGKKNETDSSTQTEQHVPTEPTALSSSLPHAPRHEVSDPHGQEVALSGHVTDQKSHQLQADKCSDVVEMSPVTVLSVSSTGTTLAADQHNNHKCASTEPCLGGNPRSGDLSPYSRFKASLKSLGHGRKDAVVTQKGDTDDIKTVEVDTKRRRLTEAQAENAGPTSQRYTFQFINFPEPTEAPPVPQLPNIKHTGPDSKFFATKPPVGILQDLKVRRQRTAKRVTFARECNTRPPGCSTVPQRTIENFDQLQKHWENIQGAFDDVGTTGRAPPQGDSLKSETSLDDNDDTMLFSDDEPAGFELGSQVERIEHFLR